MTIVPKNKRKQTTIVEDDENNENNTKKTIINQYVTSRSYNHFNNGIVE